MKDQNLPIDAIYISVTRFAEKYGVSERTARNYCATGKIEGAFLTGKTWNIPADTVLPKKGKAKLSPLLERLRQEKQGRLKGGIYHRTQIDLTYNSNHIEGSRLTKEQTRFIFETNTLGATSENTRIDDIMETVNHFHCIDFIIDHAEEPLTERFIKQLHLLLKTGIGVLCHNCLRIWNMIGSLYRSIGSIARRLPADKQITLRKMHKFQNCICRKSRKFLALLTRENGGD